MASSVFELCKKNRLSLLELADRSGLDLPRTRSIYLGRWTPSSEERQRIATALNVTVDDIAWGHETPIQHIYGHGPT
jgi:transcriptional regulator with XRE-family HTH domain